MRTLSGTPGLPASLCPGAPGAGAATRSLDPLALTRAGPPLSQRSPRNFPASSWSTAGSPTHSATPSPPARCPWQPIGTPGGRQARGQGRSSARDPNAAPQADASAPIPERDAAPKFSPAASESQEDRVRYGRPGHQAAGTGAPHPGPRRSSLACVTKSTYERERGSPERGVPAAAEAAPAGAASCALGSRPLRRGSGLLPPPPSPPRRRARRWSSSPSALGGRTPSGPRDVEEKGGAPPMRSRRGSSGRLPAGVPAPRSGQSSEARATSPAAAEPPGSPPLL